MHTGALILTCVTPSEVLQSPCRPGPGLLSRQFPTVKPKGLQAVTQGAPLETRQLLPHTPTSISREERSPTALPTHHRCPTSVISEKLISSYFHSLYLCMLAWPRSAPTPGPACSSPPVAAASYTQSSSASPSVFLLLTFHCLMFSLTCLQNPSTFLGDTPRITTQSPAELLTEPAVPVPDLPVLQHLAGVSVQMGGGDVFQGVVLEGWWGGVELPAGVQHWDAECWAVPGRRADGAHTLGRRLRRQRLPLEAVIIPSVTTPRDRDLLVLHEQAQEGKHGETEAAECFYRRGRRRELKQPRWTCEQIHGTTLLKGVHNAQVL